MMEKQLGAISRRALLRAAGATVGVSTVARAAGAQQGGQFSVVQGGDCTSITPLSGGEPVEARYGYQLPGGKWTGKNGATDDGGPYFQSTGTSALQRKNTSLLFLYDGPKGLSLVVVHGKGGPGKRGGGAATFTFSGLPGDGSWVVKDDFYLDPKTGTPADTNYDRWKLDGPEQKIDWTWGGHYTDGGAFRGLGSQFEVRIDPAFNDASALDSQDYSGKVSDWQVLSGSFQNPERHSLDLSTPVTVRSGSC
ncbi:MAG: hypothetical protein ABEJ28_02945 [Salinigranum sp.]